MRTPPSSLSHAVRDGSAGTWLFDFSPLGHWLWWAALTVLLVNDNLLKGGGLVPGWLTGKLSDFAFLVVAPVLLTTLLPLQLRNRRLLAFTAVVAVYAAADLSVAASDAIVGLAGGLGLHWRLWPDVTDLLALAALPASWWIAGASGRQPLRKASSVLQTAGLAIGVFACLATSDDPGYEHYPFLVNHTQTTHEVSLTWVLRKTDCDVDIAALAASLTSSDLDDVHSVTLVGGQVAALDAPPTPDSTMAGVCHNRKATNANDSNCMAVIVSADAGPAMLVSARRDWHESSNAITSIDACWKDSAVPSRCAASMSASDDPGPDALSLIESGGQLTFKAGAKLAAASIDLAALASRVPASPGCRALRTQIHAWLDGATACTTDTDCQALRVNLAIPGGGICNADVNLAVSPAQIDQQRAAWIAACETDDMFTCFTGVHPPVCNAGTCGELCPGIAVSPCPRTCASLAQAIGQPCSPATTSDCLSGDEQRCTCSETGPTTNTYVLTCKPQAEIPGCSIRCVPIYSATDAGATEVAAEGKVDSSPFDAQLDTSD